MASIFSIAWIGDGMAVKDCTQNPPAGKYCKKQGSQKKCPAGCYCPGGVKTAVGDNDSYEGKVTTHCSSKTASVEGYLNERGVYYCPSERPYSNEGSSSENDCSSPKGDNCPYSQTPGYFCKNIDFLVPISSPCPKGCYCHGGTKQTVGFLNVEKLCRDRTNSSSNINDLKEGKVFLCPEDFPNSNEQSKSIYDCYNEAGENYTEQQKLRLRCPDGKVANAEHTGCIEPDDQEETVHCIRGEYLPANSESCAECPDGYYCPNEKDYPINRAVSQGNERCTGNKVPNDRKDDCVPCSSGKEPDEDHATCVDAKIHVDPGQYLRANTTTPVPCSGAKKFCPGGSFYKKSVDQGRYDCPFNSNANSANTACELKLTKKQMVNGVSGNGECWLKTDPEDYKLCIYGARFENASNTPTSSSTNNAATELKGFAPTLKK